MAIEQLLHRQFTEIRLVDPEQRAYLLARKRRPGIVWPEEKLPRPAPGLR